MTRPVQGLFLSGSGVSFLRMCGYACSLDDKIIVVVICCFSYVVVLVILLKFCEERLYGLTCDSLRKFKEGT